MARLWRGPDATWFRVPDGQALPEGPVVLRSGSRTMSSTAEAIAPFAVDRDEAAAELDARLRESFGRVRDAFAAVGRTAPDLDALDPSPGRMATDPEAAKRGVEQVVEALKSRLGEHGEGLAGVRARPDELGLAATLVDVAGSLGDSRAALAGKLGELGDALKVASEKLKD